jgi:hypothetical protein
MPSNTLTSDQKATSLRIQRALAKPGATGMKGLLLWTEAAFPKAIAHEVLKAASKYTPGATPNGSVATLASPEHGGFGALSYEWGSLPADDASSDPTNAPVSPTTAATASQPAPSSWVSDIGKAFTAAATGALGVMQAIDAQKIFNTNLSLAQQGKSMIPSNPTQYGLPAPTANIGLAPSAQKTILIVGGLAVLGLVVASVQRGRRRR